MATDTIDRGQGSGELFDLANPSYNNQIYCFYLTTDPEIIFDLDRQELKKLFNQYGLLSVLI